MNSISFTPLSSNVNYSINTNYQNRPAFKGVVKPTQTQAKEAAGIAKKLYQAFFIPSKESVVKMKGGLVYTENSSMNGAKIVGKKYPIWSRKPSEIIEDNNVTGIRTHKKMKSDGVYDITIRDMHVPEYNISAEYENVSDTNAEYFHDFHGGKLKLRYCDKELELSQKQREQLIPEFKKSVADKFDEPINELITKKDYSTFTELSERYYKDPDVIGLSILNSPHSVQDQIKRVSTSMPYGIERIFEKISK